jgi:hypothetical protein
MAMNLMEWVYHKEVIMRKGTVSHTKHHRKPKSLGGSNERDNISYVTQTEHRAWHKLFSNYTPYQIANIINIIWIDTEYTLVCVKHK